jgi:hypothetical protein
MNSGSFLKGWPVNILHISVRHVDDGSALLAHVRESGGRETKLDLANGLTGRKLIISEADPAGRPTGRNVNILKPLESKFFLIGID